MTNEDLDKKVNTLLEKAGSTKILQDAQEAEAKLNLSKHHRVVKYFYKQETGKDGPFDWDQWAEEFVKRGYKLEERHAKLASHEIVAHALAETVKTAGEGYKSAIKKYDAETDLVKRAEIEKELDMYKATAQQMGIDTRDLDAMEKSGFNPGKVDGIYRHFRDSKSSIDRNALLRQIDEKIAYKLVENLGSAYGFKKTAVAPLGADNARQILLTHHDAKQHSDKKEGARIFYNTYKGSDLYRGGGKPAVLKDTT